MDDLVTRPEALLARARATAFVEQATGVPADEGRASGFYAPLDAALAHAGDQDVLRCSVEPSVRLFDGGVDTRRFTVGFPTRFFGRRPHDVVDALLAPLASPPEVRAWARALREGGHLPMTVLVGSSASDGRGVAHRLYLEQRALPAVLGRDRGPLLAALSAEWLRGDDRADVREYREVARPDPAGDPLVEALVGVADALPTAFFYERRDAEGGPAHALQAILRPVRLVEVKPALAPLFRAFDAEPALDRLAELPDAEARVVSVGVTRAGRRHATVYVGPREPLHERGDDVDPTRTDRLPGSAVLTLTRADARGHGAVVVSPPHPERRPPVTVGPHAVYASGVDVALARAVAAVLDPAAPTPLAAVASAEARVREVLAEAGWLVVSVRA